MVIKLMRLVIEDTQVRGMFKFEFSKDNFYNEVEIFKKTFCSYLGVVPKIDRDNRVFVESFSYDNFRNSLADFKAIDGSVSIETLFNSELLSINYRSDCSSVRRDICNVECVYDIKSKEVKGYYSSSESIKCDILFVMSRLKEFKCLDDNYLVFNIYRVEIRDTKSECFVYTEIPKDSVMYEIFNLALSDNLLKDVVRREDGNNVIFTFKATIEGLQRIFVKPYGVLLKADSSLLVKYISPLDTEFVGFYYKETKSIDLLAMQENYCLREINKLRL